MGGKGFSFFHLYTVFFRSLGNGVRKLKISNLSLPYSMSSFLLPKPQSLVLLQTKTVISETLKLGEWFYLIRVF